MKTITLELPAFLASYFINGDASGLEDSEIRKADSMLEREGVRIIDVARDESGEASEQFFGAWHFPEFSETGGYLLEYVAEFLPVSANAFAYARRFGRSDGSVRPARDAIAQARNASQQFAKATRYEAAPRHWFARGPQHGAPDKAGVRWIENADSIMRRVGFADEVARSEGSRRVEHLGWWTHDEGIGELFVGVVYQLTGRDGSPRYVAGYEHCETTRKRERANMTEGAWLDCSRIYSEKLEAAQAADGIAESEAENERDYQAAAGAGFHVAELLGEIQRERVAALELCAELRELRNARQKRAERFPGAIVAEYPATCAALREAVTGARRKIEKLRAKILQIAEESRWRNPEAFDESAGERFGYRFRAV